MKKFFAFILILITVFSLSACGKDTTPPVLTAAEDLHLLAGSKASDLEGLFSAEDDKDGDLTSGITLDASKVDFDTPGVYSVSASVSDSAGNTSSKEVLVTIEFDHVSFAASYDANLKRTFTEKNSLIPVLFSYHADDRKYYLDLCDTEINKLVDAVSDPDKAALRSIYADMLSDHVEQLYSGTITDLTKEVIAKKGLDNAFVIRIFSDEKCSGLWFQIEDGIIVTDNVGITD